MILLTKTFFFLIFQNSLTPMLTRKRQINENGPTPALHCSKEPTEEEVTTPDSNPNGPTVEFKLVEDMRLVTVPVTSCLSVLAIYVTFGTILFSTWEGWRVFFGHRQSSVLATHFWPFV